MCRVGPIFWLRMDGHLAKGMPKIKIPEDGIERTIGFTAVSYGVGLPPSKEWSFAIAYSVFKPVWSNGTPGEERTLHGFLGHFHWTIDGLSAADLVRTRFFDLLI